MQSYHCSSNEFVSPVFANVAEISFLSDIFWLPKIFQNRATEKMLLTDAKTDIPLTKINPFSLKYSAYYPKKKFQVFPQKILLGFTQPSGDKHSDNEMWLWHSR